MFKRKKAYYETISDDSIIGHNNAFDKTEHITGLSQVQSQKKIERFGSYDILNFITTEDEQ